VDHTSAAPEPSLPCPSGAVPSPTCGSSTSPRLWPGRSARCCSRPRRRRHQGRASEGGLHPQRGPRTPTARWSWRWSRAGCASGPPRRWWRSSGDGCRSVRSTRTSVFAGTPIKFSRTKAGPHRRPPMLDEEVRSEVAGD